MKRLDQQQLKICLQEINCSVYCTLTKNVQATWTSFYIGHVLNQQKLFTNHRNERLKSCIDVESIVYISSVHFAMTLTYTKFIDVINIFLKCNKD